jgi:predicted ATP-dependent protease
LVEVDDEIEPDERERRAPEEKDDPELATRLNRFKVNLLVSHRPGSPAPVIYDTNPSYPNLFGYLERRARYGALLTDFTRIRAGSLHRASGGVLVVRAADLLTDPIIWERIKRVLREQRIGAEDPLGPLGVYATSLRPVPVPIHVRVVLVGSPDLYASLLEADADFAALFRVKVEVDPVIPRTERSSAALDAYLMGVARERGWAAFDRGARAQLLDIATRLAGDREKLSLTLSPLEETMAFASAVAVGRTAEDPERPLRPSAGAPVASVVSESDVQAAWLERRERAGSAERHLREITVRGEVALDTSGWRVGVVNGLSVFSAGDVEFGQPMRITAVVGIGREGIIDVEREAQLGGSIHTKGVAILRGYLTRMFGQERPLSLRAQLAFEQSYGEVDGDSASSSELFAVLSALADVVIDQGIAVTGSVNQLGEMQAIGGICAKIEGFYDLCKARGLSGRQGVLMPTANRPHLILRHDVADAIAAGRFHVYSVEQAAQGIEVLTGLSAGQRDARGRFPAASVFGRVERRIIEIAERLREAEGHAGVHDGADAREEHDASDPTEGPRARRLRGH